MKVYGKLLSVLLCTVLVSITQVMAKEYIIFSITQEVSMGESNEKLQKNYYLNMGKQQGLKAGDIVDIYRTVSQVDPYNQNKRFDFRLKIGQVRILHSEETAAIAERYLTQESNIASNTDAYLDIKEFMIGDGLDIPVEM